MDRDSLSKPDTGNNIPSLIDKDKVWESINLMNNGKAAGGSGLVSEMVKPAGEGTGTITDLVNQIIVGVIPADLAPL